MTIYDLKLHESLETEDLSIIRVPNGWIYYERRMQYTGLDEPEWYMVKEKPVFVPYHPEFKPSTEKYGKGLDVQKTA